MTTLRTIALALAFFCSQASIFAADLAKPRIEVFKGKRVLQLFDGDHLIKTYRVALGTNPVPAKERQGDRATPEGSYFICQKNPKSQYHLSLGISYPGPADARRGLKDGLISKQVYKAILESDAKRKTPPWNTKLGGEVFVHGNGSSPDWTWGCIALDDSAIEELYRLVPVKTPITIHP
jgi:murein L,D-transpeptidase YafK